MKKNLIKMINDTNHKVIRVTKTEFELDNGDTYPQTMPKNSRATER